MRAFTASALRPVVASADDFTVRGGAADAALHRKFVQCEAMAHEYRLPLIRMIDGTGGGGSVKTLEDLRLELARPFEHEGRLTDLLVRQRELLKQLDLDKDEAGSAKVDAEEVRQAA